MRGFQLGAANQTHHVRFVDDANLLESASCLKGVAFHDPLAMTIHRIGFVGISKGSAHILADEPGLFVNGDRPDGKAQGGILERYYVHAAGFLGFFERGSFVVSTTS